MPKHATEDHLPLDETITLGGIPYINGEFVVWLDQDDGKFKRHIMDKNKLEVQEWDGSGWANGI